MIGTLKAAMAARARRWARRRQGADRAPVRLDSRRVYILPTSFGAIYAAIVFAMLLGSMNYNNSLGFALTFVLTGLGLVAMYHCHRNLAGLIVSGVHAGEAFAGETLKLQVGLENPSALRRYELRVACVVARDRDEDTPTLIHRIGPAARALATIEVATRRRGVLRPERLTLSTRFPFGLFRAWSWVYLPVEAVVYPQPAGEQAPPPDTSSSLGAIESRQRGVEDFRGFRSYVPGDSMRHIAWKALARGAPLMVKEYAGAAQAPVVLDFDAITQPGTEARLSQLCRWVVDADRSARVFGLRLPGRYIMAHSGAAHRRRCLEALALFETEGARR